MLRRRHDWPLHKQVKDWVAYLTQHGSRLNRLEPTLPQPFRRPVQVCRAPDKLWGKLVLVALRLLNSLQDKQAT